MRVINILKDGTIVEDLTGKVVKVEEVKNFYEIIKEAKR